jgi:acyl-CoA synthetase (AMP-forming)/AMP-acid ligase II
MIISGGENIHPVQVEAALGEHPGVADSAVVGVPDARWGQMVVAYVVPRGDGLTADELDRHCRGHAMLADFKRPRAYRFVESLPLTATGKKMHYKLAARAASDLEADLFQRL